MRIYSRYCSTDSALLSVVCKSEWSRSEDVFFCHETVLLSFRNNFFTQASVIVYLANPTPTVNLTVVTKVPFKIRPFRNEKKTGKSKFSQGLLGVLLGTTKKTGQSLTGRAPVTIPETIAGHISAPDLFWFLRWQICRISAYLNQNR